MQAAREHISDESDRVLSQITPGLQSPLVPAVSSRGDSPLVPFLTRTIVVLSVLLALRFVAPQIIEELQYAVTRGRQRAQYETAGEALAQAPLDALSRASQLVSQRAAPSVVHIETMSRSARGEVPGQNGSSLWHPRRAAAQGRWW